MSTPAFTQTMGYDYVTDTAYPAHFHREIMPVWLASTLISLGHRPPDIRAPFTWLELGCGAGLSPLIAAVCHPHGQFIGVDLDPAMIQRAQRMAAEAGLDNVQFLCADLRQMAQSAKQTDCDFMVVNGVYSWVEESVRLAIDHMIAQRLRPGGVAYLGYLCHPGAASFAAAQKLMWMATHGRSGNSAVKARHALDFLLALARAGAGYFVEHPAATREMEQASTLSDAYLAHEFLNRTRRVLHVADVMQSFAAMGCAWVGSANPLDNMDAVSLPQAAQPIVAQLRQQQADTALLETVRDILRNQNLRIDLFQNTASGDYRFSEPQHRAALLAQRLTLLPGVPQDAALGETLELNTRIGRVLLPMHHIQGLLRHLRQQTARYADLVRLPEYADNPGFIHQLVQTLVWKGWMHFMPNPALTSAQRTKVQRLQHVLHQAGHSNIVIQAQAGTAVIYQDG